MARNASGVHRSIEAMAYKPGKPASITHTMRSAGHLFEVMRIDQTDTHADIRGLIRCARQTLAQYSFKRSIRTDTQKILSSVPGAACAIRAS